MGNRYGLSRHIPEPVKRQIRQQAQFGCVVCGAIPFQYEHIDPEFAEAKEHDPTKMTLLCAAHNEQKKKGLLSKADVQHYRNNPFSVHARFTNFRFVQPRERFSFELPGVTFDAVETLVVCGDEPMLRMSGGMSASEPIVIDAIFKDEFGRIVCRIEQNEIKLFGSHIEDADQVGIGFKVIYKASPQSVLDFSFDAEAKRIVFQSLLHFSKGCCVRAKDRECRLYSGNNCLVLRDVAVTNAQHAFGLTPARRLNTSAGDRNAGGFQGIGINRANAPGVAIQVNPNPT